MQNLNYFDKNADGKIVVAFIDLQALSKKFNKNATRNNKNPQRINFNGN